MNLTAIINYWDGVEFLPYLIPNLQKQVDRIIIVYSCFSNWGSEVNHTLTNWDKVKWVHWEPKTHRPPHENEINKRNFGLKIAIQEGTTHVLMCDVDEFYDTEDFNREKERIYSSNLSGLVCGLECYFGSPTLTIGSEPTRVVFIMKVFPGMRFGPFRKFPFAYEDNAARIDPTRRVNIYRGIEWSEITMYHYSWVRKDIIRKIMNSTARNNLLKSTVMEDYINAKPGYFCEYYQRELKEVENKFGIEIG